MKTSLDLPTELWLRIFALACLDSGRTGCALSATSHRFRYLSAEYRYQSISVTSAEQIYALWEQLRSVPQSLRQIRHLHVRRSVPLAGPRYPPSDVARPIVERHSWYFPYFRETIAASLEFDEKIHDLLTWAAPTLETLSIFWVSQYPQAPSNFLGLLRFPSLAELTVRGALIVPDDNVHFAPQLQRLNVASIHTAARRSFARNLASVFPRLTHLRLSRMKNLNAEQVDLVLDLLVAFGVDVKEMEENVDRLGRIARMHDRQTKRFLYVEPGPFSDRERVQELDANALSGLETLLELQKQYPTLVTLGTHSGHSLSQDAVVVQEEWQQRLEGGEGGWSLIR